MHNFRYGSKLHWTCCVKPILGVIFWIAAIVFTAVAWISVVRNNLVWGYGAQWWIWNSLMFGILGIYGRGGHCGCANCMVQEEK
jgi:hypothetical protein